MNSITSSLGKVTSLSATISSVVLASISFGLFASTISPPSDLVFRDKAGVDLLTGQPTFYHTDLRIGHGDLSLTHTFSSSAGYFAAFHDLSKSYVDKRPTTQGTFAVVKLGSRAYEFAETSTGWGERSREGRSLVGDSGEGWIFTDRDGTEFHTGGGLTRKVVYPNGYTLEIGYGYIASNNGLQFRYDYSDNPHGAGQILNSITAINAGYVFCNLSSTCSYSSEWPKASYRWINRHAPVNNEYTFEATDAEGVVTKWVHNTNPQFNHVNSLPRNRVTKVYENGNTVPTREYTYYHYKSCSEPRSFVWACNGNKIIVDTAKVNGQDFSYHFADNNSIHTTATGRVESQAGGASITMTSYKGGRPKISQSSWRDGGASYENTDINRILGVTNKGISFDYEYDGRGNITKRTQAQTQSTPGKSYDDIVIEAGFTNSCSNKKICNQPTWTKDGEGNITDYEYHAQSGQISKVTRPADDKGIRPVTHYKYSQKYARYYVNNGSQIEQATAPIWLLTEIITCINKAATSTGCQSGDALKTVFEYGDDTGVNNLWMTGKVVTSPTGEQRRTCYEYDKLGNQIGETQPKANLSSCS